MYGTMLDPDANSVEMWRVSCRLSTVVIDFEVILGMDQLTRYYATLDYREEAVIFRLPNDEEFSFRGDKSSIPQNLISAITARKMLRK